MIHIRPASSNPALCLSLLGSSDEPEMLFTASEYLAREPLGAQQEGLVPHLLQNESAARARAVAALLLTGASELGLAARLRLSLAAMDGPEPRRWTRPRPGCGSRSSGGRSGPRPAR